MLVRELLSATCAPELLSERVVRRSDVSDRATRANAENVLQLPRVRTEMSRRSFLFRASSAWNGLSSDVRALAAGRKHTFKAAVRSTL